MSLAETGAARGRIYSCFLLKDLAKAEFFLIAIDILGHYAYL